MLVEGLNTTWPQGNWIYLFRSSRLHIILPHDRAVKFIRDQVEAYSRVSSDSDNMRSIRNPTGLAAQLAAQALKKILIGDGNGSADVHSSQDAGSSGHAYFNPMSGWSNDTVTQNKSHFCLLLKPQIVLRSEAAKDSILVLAALQGTLQSHNILDTANIDDPISGRVMTRYDVRLCEEKNRLNL